MSGDERAANLWHRYWPQTRNRLRKGRRFIHLPCATFQVLFCKHKAQIDASGYKTIFEYECFSFWNASLSGAARSYPSRRIQTCSCLSCFWCLPFWKCQVGSSVILCQVVKKQPTYPTGTDHRHKRVRFNFQTVSIPNICCVWILFLLVQPEATGQDKSKPVTVYQASGVSLC